MELLTTINVWFASALSSTHYYISPSEFLLLNFTILGILVTLISISSTLTREVRQGLIKKYYLLSPYVKCYMLILILSFFIIFLLSYYNDPFNNMIALTQALFALLFALTISFTVWYLTSLNRKWLYERIFDNFCKEISTKTNRKQRSELNYTDTGFESLDHLIQNISYIEKSDDDFIDETKIIKKIVVKFIEKDKKDLLRVFIGQDVRRIRNDSFFENLTSMFYELKFEFRDNLESVLLFQDLYSGLALSRFFYTKDFNAELNKSGRHLREFSNIMYLQTFRSTDDQKWISQYTILLSTTIDRIYDVCMGIIGLDLPTEIKKKYLFSQLSELNKVLEYYHSDESEFCEKYFELKWKKDASKTELALVTLAEQKKALIDKSFDYLADKEINILYIVLYLIEKGDLPRTFFDISFRIYKLDGVAKRYYKHTTFDIDAQTLYYRMDKMEAGVQSLPPIPVDKYRILLSFYNYVQNGEIDIKKFEKENFEPPSSFKQALADLSAKFLIKYFDVVVSDFKKFKQAAMKELDENIKAIKKEKRDYVCRTPLNTKYVQEFKKECATRWKENQDTLSRFLNINHVEGGSDISGFFGMYKLFNKDEFLDPFYNNEGRITGLGAHLGDGQANGKNRKVLELIKESFSSKIDKVIIAKDLYSDLAKEVIPNKEYFLFYGADLDIYQLPELEWHRDNLETATLKINNSTIHLCYSNIPESLMFEKNAYSLTQYKQGYLKIKEPLVIQIDTLDDTDIQKFIDAKTFETVEEAKQMVKIRIAEKFRVDRLDESKTLLIIKV